MDAKIDEAVSLFRVRLTKLSRRLRQEGQNAPESWAKMLVISAIDRLGDGVTPSQISQAENMRSSNLAALLRELEGAGWVERVADRDDRRKVRVFLTPAGKALLLQSRQQRDAWLNQTLTQSLSAEERALLFQAGELMERLAQR